jgi:hypothetical protein
MGYRGMKLKEFKYTPIGEPNIYDKYIQEMCQVSPIARIPVFNITKEFMEWKTKQNLPNIGDKQEQRLMRQHLSQHFVKTHGKMIFNKTPESGGFWGIALKGQKLTDGCSSNKANRKRVYKIDPQTNRVVETYGTLGEASKVADNDMAHKIRKKILHKGFLYTYDKPEGTLTDGDESS